jgi:hypothetical protein
MATEPLTAEESAPPPVPTYARPAWFPADAAQAASRAHGAVQTLTDLANARRRAEPPRAPRPVYARDDYEDDYLPPRRPPTRDRRRRSNFARDFLMASSLAAATAAIVGLMIYDRNTDGALSGPAFAAWRDVAPVQAPAPVPATPPPAAGTVSIVKKPIATASLAVEDAAGLAGTLIPLFLDAEPGGPDQDLALKLSGLPATAYLTAGKRLDDASWILKNGEERGVKLMLPGGGPAQTVLTVAAIETKTGELAAPVQEIAVRSGEQAEAVIIPAAAPPERQVVAERKSAVLDVAAGSDALQTAPASEAAKPALPPDIAALLATGEKLMLAGEFAGARQYFQRASDLGAKEASLKLGQSYDPLVFAEANVHGLQPDPAKALALYQDAQKAGVEGADANIEALKAHLGQ